MIKKNLFVFTALLLINDICSAQDKILVAAASDLKFAMDSVISVFEKTYNAKVNITYGSSGKLTEQIANGGPYQVFFSADVFYPEQLQSQKLTASEIYRYATGQIVLWSKKIDTKKGMDALRDPSIKKISIANPDHAPYGKRAVESLDYYRLRDVLYSKIVYGENISQTAQFIVAGATDIGIIALSLALSPTMQKQEGNFFIIPEESHRPLIQGAVITQAGANNELASKFFQFVKSANAVKVLDHFGFTKP